MAILGFLVSIGLTYLMWSVVLPALILYSVSKGATNSFPTFMIYTTVNGIILAICFFSTVFILHALGEPITEWSWGWPGYIAINFIWPSMGF